MATEKDYAVLSAYVYNDARGEGNDVILPSTWDELPISASDTTSGFAALFIGGFSAGAFRNNATGEIVAAYMDTDFQLGANNGQTASDLLTGLTIGTGLATPSLGTLKSNKSLQGPGARIIGTPNFVRRISPC